MISVRQVKAARSLLAWSQSDLSKRSGLPEPTIAGLETHDGEVGGPNDVGAKIAAAFENAGVEFLGENGHGLGVRMREPGPERASILIEDLTCENDE